MERKLFKTKMALAMIIGLVMGVLTPLFSLDTFASGSVAFESTLNVANVTAGDTTYKPSVNAKVDDVVKLEVFYHNKETENSGILAKNVNVKIAVPSDTSKSHVFTSTVTGSNIDTFVRNATVNTQINTKMAYIPGSAYRRFNKGTNQNQNWVTEKIPDSVTTSGFTIPEMQSCFNFQETITILARVTAPVVSIVKQVKVEGDKDWKTEITAKPGDKLAYLITFKNEGNVKLNDLVVRDSLPPNLEYVKGSAKLVDSLFPNGLTISDNIINGGVILGNYAPGSGGYVRLNVIVPKDKGLKDCHVFKNIGVVKSKELGEFYNTAIANVCFEKVVQEKVKLKIIKFEDKDADKVIDNDEKLLSGWQFKVTGPDNFSKTVTTGENGIVELTDLTAGKYTATETLQSGWKNITPLTQSVDIQRDTGVLQFANQKVAIPVVPAVTPEVTPVSQITPVSESLPVTGPAEAVMGTLGTISLAGVGIYFRKGKKALNQAFRFFKK